MNAFDAMQGQELNHIDACTQPESDSCTAARLWAADARRNLPDPEDELGV